MAVIGATVYGNSIVNSNNIAALEDESILSATTIALWKSILGIS